jgi:hypothetical protein
MRVTQETTNTKMSTSLGRAQAGGRRIGRCEIESKAGEGTSGVVYRAYDPLLDRGRLAHAVEAVMRELYPRSTQLDSGNRSIFP